MKSHPSYQFEDNFDVTVVLPFYKKVDIFRETLGKNYRYFQRNGIEVVIAMDEFSEHDKVLSLIKQYPLINWRLIVNQEPHPWRNPAKAINVGIRHASKSFVLVMGPDSEMVTDIIYIMRRMALYYNNSFFIGRVGFVDYDFEYQENVEQSVQFLYYGSIFANKNALTSINCYDESYENWGGDDDNLRARLQQSGLRKMRLPSALLLHRESKEELNNERHNIKHNLASRKVNDLKRSLFPDDYKANRELQWGRDFSRVTYDYRNNPYSEDLCRSYLKSALGPEALFTKEGAFAREYVVIALVSVFNEIKHIDKFLRNVEEYADGIVLLDDASEDGTYESATSEKLLLKVKRKCRERFDDLANRNTLLDIASFFRTQFYFFIDADERIDERYSDVRGIATDSTADTYCFHLVHLWDDESRYRIDIPEQSRINQPGIIQRWRMFRNIGRMNIRGERLHFEATPYKTKKAFAPILIRHYGMIDGETRSKKFARYTHEDEKLHLNPNKYDYFLDSEFKTRDVSEIVLNLTDNPSRPD